MVPEQTSFFKYRIGVAVSQVLTYDANLFAKLLLINNAVVVGCK